MNDSNGAGARAPIGFAAFAECLGRSLLFGLDGSPVRLSLNRLLATFLYLPACLILGALHAVGFAVDNLLFRGYRKIDIVNPLFVVGPPRCGTTFLQRVLARNTEAFTGFTLGEMVFAPSITEKYVFRALGKLDNLLGGPVQRWVRRAESDKFEDLNELHKVGFFEPEEDYILLAYIFANPILIAMFPFPDVLGHLWHFDEQTPQDKRRKILAFYRRCVQRHLYFHGPDKTFVSKNPYFTQMLRSIADEFPDARFVCNVRDPAVALPSMLGVWNAFYGHFKNDPEHYLAKQFVVDYMGRFYRYVSERLQDMPPDRVCLVPYDDLARDIRSAVHALYDRLGYTMTDTYDARLQEELEHARSYRSTARRELDAYGLNEDEIREAYSDIYERYAFTAG